MPRWGASVLIGVGVLLLAAGCRHAQGNVGWNGTPGSIDATVLPLIAERTYRSDLSQVPPDIPHLQGTPVARALSEQQAQCLASAESARANYLEQEAAALDGRPSCFLFAHANKTRDLEKAMLHYLALEDRNLTAGTALEQYFRLAESEAKADLLRASLTVLEQARQDVAALKKKGIKLSPDAESLQGQEWQVQQDLDRLENTIDALNDRLARLFGLEPCCRGWRFAPSVVLSPPCATTCADAVAVARALRPSLELGRLLMSEAGPHTLPAINYYLQFASGVRATSAGGSLASGLLMLCAGRSEYPSRQQQLESTAAENDRLVAEQVCQALRDLELQARLANLARARLDEQQQKVRGLEEKMSRGILSAVDVLGARLQANRLEAELLTAVGDWHIARIKLKQAQGLLVHECESRDCFH